MIYGSYHFQSRFIDDAHLPPFKGSTFRGVFGHSLKKVVCALRRQHCEECLLRERCVYTLVFENPEAMNRPGRPSPPHPFIIEPPLTTQTDFKGGDTFEFRLILLGRANDYLPYFVYAFQEMGKTGIGRRLQGRRSGFQLESICSGERIIYQSESKKLLAPSPEDFQFGPYDLDSSKPTKEITVSLVTPLRVKYQNQLQAELPFHVLVRAGLRRASSLYESFGEGEPDLDYKGMVERSAAIKTICSTIAWFDWQRYSNRQEQSMLMGGMVGEAAYQGDLDEFIPLLRFCEKVHLGKATTFGLGKFSISGNTADYSATGKAPNLSFSPPAGEVEDPPWRSKGEGDKTR